MPERRDPAARPALPAIGDDAPRRRVADRFRDNYLRYQYCIVEYLCAHLVDCARAFNGDLDKVLVLALIGQVGIRDLLDAPGNPPEATKAISASRLADVSGIPRETIRRKLKELADLGYIEASETGWRLKLDQGRSTARKALSALDEKAIQNAARLFVGLDAIVRDSGTEQV